MPELRRMYINEQEASQSDKVDIASGDLDRLKDFFCDYPELNKLKKEIQWDVFWKIIDEIAVKSGINPTDLNKLNPNTIVGIKDLADSKLKQGELLGAYMMGLNAIIIDYDKIKLMAANQNVNEKLLAIITIFHEYIHSIALVIMSTKQMGAGSAEVTNTSTQTGYQSSQSIIARERNKTVFEKNDDKFSAVNEAITEGMAFDIFKEYAQRTGDFSHKDIADYNKNFHEPHKINYNNLIQNLKKVCKIVGEKAGVQSNVVWNAFVRGVFYDKTLENSETKKWFASAFSPTFLDELGAANDGVEFFKLMNKYHVV